MEEFNDFLDLTNTEHLRLLEERRALWEETFLEYARRDQLLLENTLVALTRHLDLEAEGSRDGGPGSADPPTVPVGALLALGPAHSP